MLNQDLETNVSKILLMHSRADRALRSVISTRLDEFDVTMMEWLLLGVVKQGPSEGLSMSSIASELDVTLPQVTALMNSLVKKKLVKLKTQRQDRRSRHASLTTRGEEVLKRVEEKTRDAISGWPKDVSRNQQSAYMETIKAMAYTSQPSAI